MHSLFADVRYGLRQLRVAPRFTLAVVLVLALGIGANTAVFSAIDAAFLRPLPFPAPDRLVALSWVNIPAAVMRGRPAGMPSLDDYRTDTATFASVAAYASGGLNLTGGNSPERASITYVTADFFSTIGHRAMLGRVPDSVEFAVGGPKVAVLSHALWRREFGGATNVIGHNVRLNGESYTVIGVMPEDFHFPSATDLWLPLALPFDLDIIAAFRNTLPAQVIARLAPLSHSLERRSTPSRCRTAFGRKITRGRRRCEPAASRRATAGHIGR